MNDKSPQYSQDDISNAITILKKVKLYEQSNEYSRFLFIMAIIGIIAIFEGFVAYLIERYVGVSVTKVIVGYGFAGDPVLIIGIWIVQIAIFSSLILYTSIGKGLLDTWTPYLKKMGLVWAIAYLSSFVINVILIQAGKNYEVFGPSIWSIGLGLAFLFSERILKPLGIPKSLSRGFLILTFVMIVNAFIIYFIEKIFAMFIIGMVLGVSLLILAGLLYIKS